MAEARRPSRSARTSAGPPPAEAPGAPDSRAVLFPRGHDVRISGERTVTVRPWSIGLLIEVSQRLPELLQDLFESDGDAAAASLIPGAAAEIRWIVAQTVGWSEDDIGQTWTAEDLLDVALVVVEVCVLPLSEKLTSLGMKLLGMAPQAATRIPTPRPTPASPSPGGSSS